MFRTILGHPERPSHTRAAAVCPAWRDLIFQNQAWRPTLRSSSTTERRWSSVSLSIAAVAGTLDPRLVRGIRL